MGRSGNRSKIQSKKTASRARAKDGYTKFMEENLNAHYITDEAELKETIKYIKSLKPSQIGLDFETASKNGRFGIQNGSVRLIQIGIGEKGIKPEQFVIDCHSTDPKWIKTLLTDPSIEKQILNLGFEQNWTVTQLGAEIKNIYDPMWAWRVIQRHLKKMDQEDIEKIIPGYKPHGNSLAELTKTYLGIDLPKGEQASNWAKRTLTTSQIIYAANDSSIMMPLTDVTKKVVSDLGLEDEVKRAIENANKKTITTSKKQIEEIRDDSERLIIAIKRAQTRSVLENIYRSGQVLSIHNENRKKVDSAYKKRVSEFESS